MELDLDISLSTTPLRRLGAVLKWTVVATLLALIVRVIATNWPDLNGSAISCNWTYLLLAVVLLCVHYLLCAALWHELTVANETAITRREAIRAWFYSLLGKYIPGKVVLWAGRVLPYRRAGHGIKRVTACFILELAFQLLAACIIGLVALAYTPDSPLQDYRQAAWLLIVILAGAIHPRVLQSLLNFALRLLRREPVTIEMNVRQMLVLFLGYLANSLVFGASFLLFVKALYPVGVDQFLYLTAALLITGFIGVLSVFAPGGLGVREGGLMLALCVIMPQPNAAVIVLGARVWTTVGELLCVSITFIHDKITRRRNIARDTQRAAGFSPRDSSDANVNPHRAAGGMKSRPVGSPRGPTPANQRSALMILSLLGFLLVMVSTTRYGVGLSPDSTNYIAAARSLAQGEGFIGVDGAPYTHWPPLYPAILAAPAIIGVDPLVGARWINAAAFGVIIFLAGGLFFTYLHSTALALLGTVSIVLANPLYGLSTLALSEPIFVVLTILFFTQTLRYLQHAQPRQLRAMALLAMLCCLQRYIGVSVVAAGAVVILFLQSKLPLAVRIKHLFLFGVISCTPLGVWLLRNYALTVGGDPYAPPSKLSLVEGLTLMSETLTSWLLPETLPLWFRLAAVALVLVALIGAVLMVSKRPTVRTIVRSPQFAVAAVFVLTYSSMVLAIALTIRIADLDNRTMLPTYVFLFLLLLAAVDRMLVHLPTSRGAPRWARNMVLGFCMLWLTYPLLRVGSRTWHRLHNGAGGYATTMWAESPTMKRLLAHMPIGRIYSNSNDAVYIYTTTHAQLTASTYKPIGSFVASIPPRGGATLVWFERGRNKYYRPHELARYLEVKPVQQCADGAIYHLRRRGSERTNIRE